MDNILREMVENQELCRIVYGDSGMSVKLRPIVISQSLNNKLSPEDISIGASIINRQIKISNIKTNLYRQCNNTNCKVKDKCVFRAVPNGNTNADVMLLNKMPTEYEVCNMASHCDRAATFLSLILSKMNVSRDSVYCTDMIKCNIQLDEQSYNECINTYLAEEIECVKPKVIICNGLSVLKACTKSGVLQDLPLDVTYGKLYDARTLQDVPIKVIAIYDLDTVLKKTDDSYEKCKTELWTQLLTAFRASV